MKELTPEFFEKIYPLKLSEDEIVLKVIENDKEYFEKYKDYINNEKYIYGVKSAIKMKEYEMLDFLLKVKDFDIHKNYNSSENVVLYVMKHGNLKAIKIVYLNEKFDIKKCEFCIYELISLHNSVEALDFIINNHEKHSFLYQYNNYFYLLSSFIAEGKYEKIKVIINNETYKGKAHINYLQLLNKLIIKYKDTKGYKKLIDYILSKLEEKEIKKIYKKEELLLVNILSELIKRKDKRLFNKIYFNSVLSSFLKEINLNKNLEYEAINVMDMYLFKCLEKENTKVLNQVYFLLNIGSRNIATNKGSQIENKGYKFINYLIKVNKIEFSIDNLILIINNHEDYFEYLFENNSYLFNVINEKLIEEKVMKNKKEKIKMKFKMLRF